MTIWTWGWAEILEIRKKYWPEKHHKLGSCCMPWDSYLYQSKERMVIRMAWNYHCICFAFIWISRLVEIAKHLKDGETWLGSGGIQIREAESSSGPFEWRWISVEIVSQDISPAERSGRSRKASELYSVTSSSLQQELVHEKRRQADIFGYRLDTKTYTNRCSHDDN